jgi:hypothetical protein
MVDRITTNLKYSISIGRSKCFECQSTIYNQQGCYNCICSPNTVLCGNAKCFLQHKSNPIHEDCKCRQCKQSRKIKRLRGNYTITFGEPFIENFCFNCGTRPEKLGDETAFTISSYSGLVRRGHNRGKKQYGYGYNHETEKNIRYGTYCSKLDCRPPVDITPIIWSGVHYYSSEDTTITSTLKINKLVSAKAFLYGLLSILDSSSTHALREDTSIVKTESIDKDLHNLCNLLQSTILVHIDAKHFAKSIHKLDKKLIDTRRCTKMVETLSSLVVQRKAMTKFTTITSLDAIISEYDTEFIQILIKWVNDFIG